MKHLLKWMHLLGVVGCTGALGVALVLAADLDRSTSENVAGALRAIATVIGSVAVPSLVLMVASGLLLTVKTPAYFEARWVWLKALLGVAVGVLLLGLLQPAAQLAAAFAGSGAFGSPVFGGQQAAVERLQWAGVVVLALCLTALAVAVWRPRLGRRG